MSATDSDGPENGHEPASPGGGGETGPQGCDRRSGGSSGPIRVGRAAGRQLRLAVVVQVLAVSCWFSVSVVVPSLRVRWDLSDTQVSWLTGAVQIGFAAGAIGSALLRLADRVAPRILIPAACAVTALVTAAPALFDLGYLPTVVLRAAAGIGLAAVYPPGMRVVTSWYRARRGSAVSAVVAALTLGTALPHLGEALPVFEWRAVLLCASAAALLAGALATATRPGPYVSPPGKLLPSAALWLFRDRRQRLATLAYLGHMWEVYSMWVWLPTLLTVTAAGGREGGVGALLDPSWGSFTVIGVAGVAGCLLAGRAADRFGTVRVASVCLAASGLCCLTTPLLPVLPAPAVAVILLVWGAAVIGDSPLYSALLGDLCSPRAVGTALTMQMAVGYALSVMSIWTLPLMANEVGWRYACTALAVGPAIGLLSLRLLHKTF